MQKMHTQRTCRTDLLLQTDVYVPIKGEGIDKQPGHA